MVGVFDNNLQAEAPQLIHKNLERFRNARFKHSVATHDTLVRLHTAHYVI